MSVRMSDVQLIGVEPSPEIRCKRQCSSVHLNLFGTEISRMRSQYELGRARDDMMLVHKARDRLRTAGYNSYGKLATTATAGTI